MERIPVAGPSITEREVELVSDAVRHAWYGDANLYLTRFERAFADYIGTRHAIALPSCTAGIHLSLLALGIGPGDEVIVPDVTWIASSAPISYVGATPVFADIDRDTWCLSVDAFRACITARTRAVVVVHLYGGMAEMDAIMKIADQHNIAVIEDAAQAIGSEYHGVKAGAFGTTSVFSFNGAKTLTTGEGGIFLTDDDDLHNRVQTLRDHGRKTGERLFWNTELGYKYRMSNMQAALGLAQLERVSELIDHKRRIFSWYQQALSGVAGVILNSEPEDTYNTYWMVTAVVSPATGRTKEDLIRCMDAAGVDCRPVFYPLSSLPAYENLPQALEARRRNGVSYGLSPYGINLPSGYNMTEELVHYVCTAFRRSLIGGSDATANLLVAGPSRLERRVSLRMQSSPSGEYGAATTRS